MDVWMLVSWWIIYHDIRTHFVVRTLGVELDSTQHQISTIFETSDLKI
jgi:hypothetical protein